MQAHLFNQEEDGFTEQDITNIVVHRLRTRGALANSKGTIYTPPQVAKIYGVSEYYVRQAMELGLLPFYEGGLGTKRARYQISELDLNEFDIRMNKVLEEDRGACMKAFLGYSRKKKGK